MMSRAFAARLIRLALLAALPAVSACDDEELMPPDPSAGTMFARYAAIGNSITAGFQSAGINDSTQRESYVVLLAQQMGHTLGETFNYPALDLPGCPPPLVNVFQQSRIATIPNNCAFRTSPIPTFLNNVAVPGAAVIDVLTNLDTDSDPNPLTTILLGGRTQLEWLRDVKPTFVSVWIGNNDALGTVLAVGNAGDPALVTEPATFAQRYGAMLGGLDGIGSVQGGVLIGVAQVAFIPYLTQGRVWEAFEQQFDAQTSPANALDVTEASCLDNQPLPTGDTLWVSVPFHHGAPKLAEAVAKMDSVQDGTLNPFTMEPAVIDCTVADVVTVPEMVNLVTAVSAYNQAIADAATARGWAFVDPNELFRQAAAQPGQIRAFPAFDPTDPQHETAPFGATFSRDGVHPSTASHVLVADAVIQAINGTYGTSIPAMQ